MISLSRSLLRQEGIRVPSGSATTFAKRVRELELPDELSDAVEPLLKAHEQVCAQIEEVDKKVTHAVKSDERVQRLTSVPSVGPVTAATFIALVDDIGRFDSKAKLSSYLGLVPREYSSGEKQQRGHITKAGNSRMRSLLVECAWGVLRRRNPKSEPLEQWAHRGAPRQAHRRRGSRSKARRHPVRHDQERSRLRARQTQARGSRSGRVENTQPPLTRIQRRPSTHPQSNAVEHVRRSSAMFRLAAVESRRLGCTDLRSNPTMRRGHRGRLVEREQKAESHLVTMLWEHWRFVENGETSRTQLSRKRQRPRRLGLTARSASQKA
jgi:hypothetical protein